MIEKRWLTKDERRLLNPHAAHFEAMALFIRESSDGQAVVGFNTDFGMDAGLKYLLHREGIPIEDFRSQATHIIVIPKERTESSDNERIFGAMKVIESSHQSENPKE